MITKTDFTIDWETIQLECDLPKNSALRKWFEAMDFDLREQIQEVWIEDMERLRVSLPFFLWFPTFTSKHGMPERYKLPSIHVQTTLFKVWHFAKGGSVSAVHPPVTDLKVQVDGRSLLATPFRKGREGDSPVTNSDVQKIHQQLNFTNTAISTIAVNLHYLLCCHYLIYCAFINCARALGWCYSQRWSAVENPMVSRS